VAKTRAQRKAERRRRQAAEQRGLPGRDPAELEQEERAQEDTRRGVSGEVAEAEAVIETGARTEDYGESVEPLEETPPGGDGSAVPGVLPDPVRPETAPAEPEAPAPSRADVGRPVDARARDSATREMETVEAPPPERRESRRERRAREKEDRRKARAREQQRAQAEKPEKRRGPILGFLLSCWAELKRVQWPDRDTLVQASAVTFIFVAVMAAYLGGLDAAFNWLIKQII
jgi:preprotein translocase SecE subunit